MGEEHRKNLIPVKTSKDSLNKFRSNSTLPKSYKQISSIPSEDHTKFKGRSIEIQSEDEELALIEELNNIKSLRQPDERQKIKDRQIREEESISQKIYKDENIIRNSSLDLDDGKLSLERYWDEDVVFKKQIWKENTLQKEFINDTVRSHFHKQFID